ncbi:hypothetical protein ACHAQA_000812 [Verticillium albo-atrum]
MATDTRASDVRLDKALLAVLPAGGKVIAVSPSGISDYCRTSRIDVQLPNGQVKVFFEKAAIGMGLQGFDLIQAHWTSETSLYRFIPDFMPKPVGTGSYEGQLDVYFFVMEFVDMVDEDMPSAEAYMAAPIMLYQKSVGKSPGGKFGFPVKTRFGDMEQDNDWESSWELWWTNHMKMVFEREERICGPHTAEVAQLKKDFMEMVLPRYLRPMESEGRELKPCLVHTDLRPGNVKYKPDGKSVVVHGANAVWGHNEMELALFRNPRYPFGDRYLEEYRKHVPPTEPAEDADSRNTMYMIRHQVCLATLFANQPMLREIFVNNMRRMVHGVMDEQGANAKGMSTGMGMGLSGFQFKGRRYMQDTHSE